MEDEESLYYLRIFQLRRPLQWIFIETFGFIYEKKWNKHVLYQKNVCWTVCNCIAINSNLNPGSPSTQSTFKSCLSNSRRVPTRTSSMRGKSFTNQRRRQPHFFSMKCYQKVQGRWRLCLLVCWATNWRVFIAPSTPRRVGRRSFLLRHNSQRLMHEGHFPASMNLLSKQHLR